MEAGQLKLTRGRDAETCAGDLCAIEISRTYAGVTALLPTSITVAAGQHVAIVGRSGAGKSTLIHLLGAVDRPTSGVVEFEGHDFKLATDEQLAAIRRKHFGFVFQSDRLIPYLTAEENVAIPLLLLGQERKIAIDEARLVLDQLGIGGLSTRRPSEMSGGEAQRVAIARAVVHNPDIVIADEPTGNIDSENATAAMALLRNAARPRTLIMVTHDEMLASGFDRCVRLHDGKIESDVTYATTR